MHVGWQQHIKRGLRMSEGPGCIQRNGACPGWSWDDSSCVAICGAVHLDAGVVTKMCDWGPDTCISMGTMDGATLWLL